MNRTPPPYFEEIRSKAEKRWKQLESDPDLAGPWHQLFMQVQSPRHVLSELLQNADDAGATQASAEIDDGHFVFSHNGEDFKPEHLASLCRFAYSNKRSLHTIGFRGIGFKSIFSLGSPVELITPTLSVSFDKNRFTLPHWTGADEEADERTRIRVRIDDSNRRADLEKNLTEWRSSPVSLLFFQNIRQLVIEGVNLAWNSAGGGPIANSEWYELEHDKKSRLLVIRSEYEPFPDDALKEIRQERNVSDDKEFSFPPSQVEIVLGADPGIYVVLPTGVRPELPFACNAPFMQDPARVKIKDPQTSATNRWLLTRVGKLAAESMYKWVSNCELDITERARAYELLVNPSTSLKGIEEFCSQLISEVVITSIPDETAILTQDGSLAPKGRCVSLEKAIQHVWTSEQYASCIDPSQRPLISEHIQFNAVQLLDKLRFIERIPRQKFIILLDSDTSPPLPTFENLLALWYYVFPEVTGYRGPRSIDELPIVPIEARESLYPSKSAVRLTSRKGRLAESDIDFISSHLYAVSTEWIGFLDSVLNQDDSSSSPSGSSLESQCSAALQMLGLMGLDSDSDPTKLASKVFESLNSSVDTSRIDYIQLTHICAQLNCSVPKNFTYFVRSGLAKNIKEGLCSDHQGAMQGCLPSDRYETTCISADYHASIDTSFLDKWNAWINSPKSGLRQLIPLTPKEFNTNCYKVFLKHVSERYDLDILAENLPYSHRQFYNTQWYTVTDYDLDDSILAYWQENGTYASNMRRLVHEMLTYSCEEWIEYPFAKLLQTTTSGNKEIEILHGSIPSSWLTRLRSFECVPDTQGNFCRPQELLRMSPETEALSGIERFIENKYDTEKNHLILDVLGVSGDTPGPLMLLSLLETLSRLEKIAYSETSRLYRQLDQVFRDSADDDKALIANAFADKPLLLTEQGNWARTQDVFISNDGLDLDGLQTVLNDLQDLSLWRQLSVRERPNDEAAVAYIQSLPLAQDLGSRSLELIASFLRRYGEVILSRCCAWLSLESQLLNVHSFRFATLSHSLSTDSLFVSVKQDTADLRFLDKSVANSVSNSLGLPRLEELLLFRTVDDHPDLRSEGVPSWLMSFGQCLQRVRYSDPDCQEKTRLMGVELSTTELFYLDDIRIIPYIEGVPVGPQVICEIALVETRLYSNKTPPPRLAKLIVNEISSRLPTSELANALAYCVDRRSADIVDYFEANFNLESVAILKPKVGPSKANSQNTSNEADENSGPVSHSDSLMKVPESGAGFNASKSTESEASDLLSSLTIGSSDRVLDDQPLDGMQNESGFLDFTSSQGNDHAATKQDVIKCFALSLGMDQISDGFFQAEQGIKLLRQRGELFPWVLLDLDGSETQRFFVLGSPARMSPFVLGSELYGLLQSQSSAYSLLAPHPESTFELITGNMLSEMVKDELVAIFPASYRLVLVG